MHLSKFIKLEEADCGKQSHFKLTEPDLAKSHLGSGYFLNLGFD